MIEFHKTVAVDLIKEDSLLLIINSLFLFKMIIQILLGWIKNESLRG